MKFTIQVGEDTHEADESKAPVKALKASGMKGVTSKNLAQAASLLGVSVSVLRKLLAKSVKPTPEADVKATPATAAADHKFGK